MIHHIVHQTAVVKSQPYSGGDVEMDDDELFDLARRCYCEANKDYLQKQIQIASEYLTEDKKTELRQKGILV